jgi:hypothetical protein
MADDVRMDERARDPADGPSARQRRFAIGLVVALVVPGLVGFDVWPLTGWRLFSVARGPEQIRFVIEAVAADGTAAEMDPDDLPLGYHNAEWPMSELPSAGSARRDEVCEALLDATVDARPGTVSVRLLRDRQTLVRVGGEWRVDHDPDELVRCAVAS